LKKFKNVEAVEYRLALLAKKEFSQTAHTEIKNSSYIKKKDLILVKIRMDLHNHSQKIFIILRLWVKRH